MMRSAVKSGDVSPLGGGYLWFLFETEEPDMKIMIMKRLPTMEEWPQWARTLPAWRTRS